MLSKYRLDYKRNRYATAIIDISGATLLHYKKNELLKNIKKILVIRLDHIGDVIVSVPALRALRKSYPNASITIMVRSLTKELLEKVSSKSCCADMHRKHENHYCQQIHERDAWVERMESCFGITLRRAKTCESDERKRKCIDAYCRCISHHLRCH